MNMMPYSADNVSSIFIITKTSTKISQEEEVVVVSEYSSVFHPERHYSFCIADDTAAALPGD